MLTQIPTLLMNLLAANAGSINAVVQSADAGPWVVIAVVVIGRAFACWAERGPWEL